MKPIYTQTPEFQMPYKYNLIWLQNSQVSACLVAELAVYIPQDSLGCTNTPNKLNSLNSQ